ncbi:MAG: hypothetical protein NVSMB33_02350 [Ktedonobacteraceae bacterium]
MLRLTDRASLSILIVLAPLVWGGLLLFTRFVPPHSPLAYLAFFVLLGVALICTFSPLAYFIGLHLLAFRHYRATVPHSLRQAALLSLCVIINLMLLSLNSWNIFVAFITLIAAIVIEVISLARK